MKVGNPFYSVVKFIQEGEYIVVHLCIIGGCYWSGGRGDDDFLQVFYSRCLGGSDLLSGWF